MTSRYVVLLDSATPEQDAAFREWIATKGLKYWHWLSQTWLLVDTKGRVDMPKIRAAARERYDNCHMLVLELRPSESKYDSWAGYGPTGKKSMFTWLKGNWNAR